MPSRAGSPNKNKQFLLNRLQDMYGDDFHPIMKMAENAVTLQKIADEHKEDMVTLGKDDDGNVAIISASGSANAALQAWDKIAPYTEPKLKALEVFGTGEDGAIKLEAVERTIVDPKDTNS